MADDTEVPVTLAFLADVQDLQEGTDEVEDATEEAINNLQTLADVAGRIAKEAVDAVAGSYDSLKREIQLIAAGSAAALGATSVGIFSLGKKAVEAASSFEDLRARLHGLTGDAETANRVFNSAVDFAARTPFSVESIVAATSQLEAFGVGGAENLELVANIAAATQGRIEDVSLRVAKALSGSSEGFQALRDTAGITGAKLAQFGAKLSTASLVSVKTAEDVKAATEALKELGRVKFGGSIDRAAESLTGAISNAKDALTNFYAVIGNAAIPPLIAFARAFATSTNAATEFIRPISPVITAVGTMAGVFTGAIGAVAGLIVPFAGLIAKSYLMKVAINLAVRAVAALGGSRALLVATVKRVIDLGAGIGVAAGRISIFSTVATSLSARVLPLLAAGFAKARVAVLALLASPAAPWMLAFAAGAGIAGLALRELNEEQKAVNAELDRSSAALSRAQQGWREYRDIVAEATGTDISFGGNVAQSAKETAEALKNLSPAQAANALDRVGKSVQDLSSDLDGSRRAADGVRARMVAFQEALNSTETGLVDVFRQGDSTKKILKETFGNDVQIPVEKIEQAMKGLNIEFVRLGQQATVIRFFQSLIGQVPPLLQQATSDAKALGDFLQFTSGIDSVDQLTQALGEADGRLAELEAKVLSAVGTLDRLDLAKALGDPNLGEKRGNAIKAYLGVLQKREGLEQRISGLVDKARKAEIDAYDEATARIKLKTGLELDEERKRVEGKLALVEKGSKEELAILQELARLKEKIDQDTKEKAENLLKDQLEAVRDALDDVKSDPSAKAGDVSAELRGSIAQLEAFGRANKAAFDSAPEAADRFRQAIGDLKRELQGSEAKELSDQFRQLKKDLEGAFDDQASNAQQFHAISAAIDTVKSAIRSGTVDQAQAEQYIVDLTQKQRDLNREITDEKLKQANDIAQLNVRALEEDIQFLELRQQAGEKVDNELRESREKLLQARLDAIETEYQAELARGENSVVAEKRASLARTRIYRQETRRKFDELRKQQQTAATSAGSGLQSLGTQRVSAPSGFAPTGSPARPGTSGSASFFSGVNFSGFEGFGTGFGQRRRSKLALPRFDAIQQRVQDDQKARDRGRERKVPKAAGAFAQTLNATFNIKGDDPGFVKRRMAEDARKLVDQQRRNRLQGRGDLDPASPVS